MSFKNEFNCIYRSMLPFWDLSKLRRLHCQANRFTPLFGPWMNFPVAPGLKWFYKDGELFPKTYFLTVPLIQFP